MESFFEWEYRLLMFLQNSIRGPVQNKIMWCITSLENAGFLSIAACLALLLQPRYRRNLRPGLQIRLHGLKILFYGIQIHISRYALIFFHV